MRNLSKVFVLTLLREDVSLQTSDEPLWNGKNVQLKHFGFAKECEIFIAYNITGINESLTAHHQIGFCIGYTIIEELMTEFGNSPSDRVSGGRDAGAGLVSGSVVMPAPASGTAALESIRERGGGGVGEGGVGGCCGITMGSASAAGLPSLVGASEPFESDSVSLLPVAVRGGK